MPLITWIWYGPPIGIRFGSRTQNASSDAGPARIWSASSWGRMASTMAVPRIWTYMATSALVPAYCCTAVCASYLLSTLSSSTLYLPATPPLALSASK